MIRKIISVFAVALVSVVLVGCDQAKDATKDAAAGAADQAKAAVDTASDVAKDKAADVVPEGAKDTVDGAIDQGAEGAKDAIDSVAGWRRRSGRCSRGRWRGCVGVIRP